MNSYPQISDFFTAGGTLPPDAPSYVKRPTDDELYRYIMAGEFCYVLTPRQMGKSSLMIRTAQRLSSAGVKSAIVDLTQIGTVDSEDQWYKGILTQIKRRLRLSVDPVNWWEQRKDIPNIQKFIEFFEEMLSEVKEHVVIFIDEIDTTLKLDFRDDFFAGIRAMFNARAENPDLKRVTFVLLGVVSPSDLIKDRNRTPFNIGQEIPLRSFSREEASMLEKGLDESYPGLGRKILDRIFYWTNGHPYLTQKLCQGVVETRLKEYHDSKIDLLVKSLFTSEDASRETNLQFVRDNILNYPERRVVLLLYKKLLRGFEVHDNKNSLPLIHLKLSGLVRVEYGKLVISNEIYRKVFDQKWVNKYTEIDWRYPVITVLSILIISFTFVFYNDGVRLPTLAATSISGAVVYKDDRGIQYLAELFRMRPYIFSNEYEYKAKDVFFNSFSSWDEQKALIEISYGEPRPFPEDYKIVVGGLYTSLADVNNSGQTTKLLEVMQSSMRELGIQDDVIYQEIGCWLEARASAKQNNFEDALANYSCAINLNPQNPATLFERARIYTLLSDYESALKEYERVAAIVSNEDLTEPTEIPTLTNITIPVSTQQNILPTLSVKTPASINQLVTATVIVTATPLIPSASAPIQSQFLTSHQRLDAVKRDLYMNEGLTLFYLQASSGDFPNLTRNIPR